MSAGIAQLSNPLIINQNITNLNSEAIPSISVPTHNVLRNILKGPASQLYAATAKNLSAFKYDVQKLQNIKQQLQSAKDHPTRDKILSFVMCALAIGVICGAVFGSIAINQIYGGITGGAIVIGFALGMFLLYLLTICAFCRNLDPPTDPISGLPMLIAGPFVPIYEAFTRESRLTKKELFISEKIKELQANELPLIKALGTQEKIAQETIRILEDAHDPSAETARKKLTKIQTAKAEIEAFFTFVRAL